MPGLGLDLPLPPIPPPPDRFVGRDDSEVAETEPIIERGYCVLGGVLYVRRGIIWDGKIAK